MHDCKARFMDGRNLEKRLRIEKLICFCLLKNVELKVNITTNHLNHGVL